MKKFYLSFLSFLFFYCSTTAQQQSTQVKWLNTAQLYDNGGLFNTQNVSNCSDGSVVVVGYFDHTVDFDPGPDTFNITGNADYIIFIAKYSAQGKLIFAYGFGSPANCRF